MKLERLHEYVTVAVVTLLGMGFAVYCGRLSGTGQTRVLIAIFALLLVSTICLAMRSRIWLLIPVMGGFTGQLLPLPVPFAVRDLSILLAFGLFLLLVALKIVRDKPTYTRVDLLVLMNILYVASLFLRNPVGVKALGSEYVGGRPYFEVLIAVFAYWVLLRARADVGQLRRIPIYITFTTGLLTLVNVFAIWFPAAGAVLARTYTGVSSVGSERPDDRVAVESSNRKVHFYGLGIAMVSLLCSYFPPLTLAIPVYVMRFSLFMLGMGSVLVSGFRNGIISVGLFFVLGSYFQRGWREAVKVLVIGTVLTVLVVGGHGTFYELPRPAQRALSFLPGKWDPIALTDAQGSTEWRLDMWKLVLRGDKYIRNKLLGDGFGFSRRELHIMTSNMLLGEQSKEDFLIVGAFHSGPLSTVRYAGFVGLALIYALFVAVAVLAVRLIIRTRGTPLLPVTLFFGIPLIYQPFFYTFVFGAYDNALPSTIVSVGLLKLLWKTMEQMEHENGLVPDTASLQTSRRRPAQPMGAT